jgi:hypothetical protein
MIGRSAGDNPFWMEKRSSVLFAVKAALYHSP